MWVARHALLIGFGLLMLTPLLWMVSTSLKTAVQAIAAPPVLVPNPLVWVNYPDAFQRMNYPRAMLNTGILNQQFHTRHRLACRWPT